MIIQQDLYDGSLIHKRFAYSLFRKNVSPFGNIVAFRAPMRVVSDGLIDLEDSLTNDFIYSKDAVNFCWEIPGLCPLGAVSFQRLLNTGIASILNDLITSPIEVRGDDLMVHERFIGSDGEQRDVGKVSVSITYSKEGVALGHTGINIDAGEEAPGFAYSSKLSDEHVDALMRETIAYFNKETVDQFIATTKISL